MKQLKQALVAAFALCAVSANAQNVNGNGLGADIINTVTTAVPFLRIPTDARSGGMGDVGLAISPDACGGQLNPAKMAFIEKDFGFGVSFTPWLRSLVNDIYLADLRGYYKVKKMQTVSLSLRYFSLGQIQFTDENGNETRQFRPNEFSMDAHYARKLSNIVSVAIGLRYIYSNLASGESIDGSTVRAGHSGAGDLAVYVNKNFKNGANMNGDLMFGMAITNIGAKISYTSNVVRDFIPTNLGIGFGYTLNVTPTHSITAAFDVNKLLVPTPDTTDADNDGIMDFRQVNEIAAIGTSWGDAPGGFKEEMREFTIGVGAEYMYKKQFGVRFGYFYEPRTKGARQFLTAGLTVKYSVVGLNFSYLIPTTSVRNPLDNTLRFSLLFEFANGGKKKEGSSGISLVDDTPKEKKKKKDKSDTETQTPGQ